MLDAQVDDFASRDRFADAVLGLLSVTERVRRLAEVAAANPPAAGSDAAAITDFFLGIISAGRTLRAVLGAAHPEARDADQDRHAPARAGTDARILR